jgi:hypothetical protein
MEGDPAAGNVRFTVYDPNDPVPTRGGTTLGIALGVFDQTKIEEREDVLDVLGDLVALSRVAAHLEVLLDRQPREDATAFRGMGDFYVPPAGLKRDFGIRILRLTAARVRRLAAGLTRQELDRERDWIGSAFSSGK